MLRSYNFPFVIGRFFNVVGPRQVSNYGMVIPTFVEAAKDNKPLIVYGDGKQTRCFCSIRDVVKILSKLITTKSAYNQTYNIGTNQEISIAELATKVIKAFGSNSTIEYKAYSESFSRNHADVFRRVPDITKLVKLGLQPTCTLDDILTDIKENL